ncbi:hypothetical protein SASPL_156153 [Salvia splendens]|uniref:Uncharacterized protein n=1 Tax=Salvia splendens TaxID=180675 RepID=A0A8X8VX89_SALSN|nr:hypothetical protein SASPL_156153 [Salvia splendens]
MPESQRIEGSWNHNNPMLDGRRICNCFEISSPRSLGEKLQPRIRNHHVLKKRISKSGSNGKKLEAQCEGHWRRMDAKFDALKKAILYLSISSQGEVSTMGVDSLVEQLSGVMEEEIVNDGLVEQLSGIVEEESIMLGKDAIGNSKDLISVDFTVEVLGLLLKPEQPKEKTPTMSSVAMPYTGGDIKKSGELDKMFDIPMDSSRSCKSGPINSAPTRSGSFGGASFSSGQLNSVRSGSVSAGGGFWVSFIIENKFWPTYKHGEPLKKSSGPQGGGTAVISPKFGSYSSSSADHWPHYVRAYYVGGPLNSIDRVLHAKPLLFAIPFYLLFVVILFAAVASVFTWNTCWGRRAITSFIASYPDAELRTAKDGQFVKFLGNRALMQLVLTSKPECCPSKFSFLLLKVVTCGNVPLESSFQRVPRCVYTSTSLYEYRGWDSKAANPTHRRFTWGLRTLERHVVDFYNSDFQSGLRALVKTGYGARNPSQQDASGTNASFQASLEGIVLRCEDTSEVDVIPV